MRAFSFLDRTELTRLAGRLIALARTEIALLTALLVGAAGVLTFIEIADEMADAEGRVFDSMVLDALRPHADPGHAWGPWWLEEAMADVTSLGGISVLGLFAVAVIGFLVIQRKRLSALMLLIGLALTAAAALAFASLFGWSLDLSGARGQVIAANALLAMVVSAELLRAGLTLALLPRR